MKKRKKKIRKKNDFLFFSLNLRCDLNLEQSNPVSSKDDNNDDDDDDDDDDVQYN